MRDASLLGFAISAVLFVFVLLTGKQFSHLFLDTEDAQVVAYSYPFLVFTAAGYCLVVLVNTVRFTIQGMGFSTLAIISGVLEMITRSLVGIVAVPLIGYTGICLEHPMAWILADAFLIPDFFYCRKKIAGLYRGREDLLR